MTWASRPTIDEFVDLPPSAQIEVTDAKVGAIRKIKRFSNSREKRLIDVIEYARHGA